MDLRQLKLVILLLILLEIEQFYCNEKFEKTDYCDPDLCPKEGKHIACNNDGKFAPECGNNPKIIKMTTYLICQILHWINVKRYRIANGKVEGYPPAKRMPEVEWCDELAYLAEFNVKQCKMKHDKCRNTKEFAKAGQNLAIRSTTGVLESPEKNFKFAINEWFDEYKDADEEYIDSYHSHPEGKMIGHFTLLVTDRAQKVGCAACEFSDEKAGRNRTLIACNFSATNIRNFPVYEKGKTASGCTTGSNDYYTGLCSPKEKVSSVPEKRKSKRN